MAPLRRVVHRSPPTRIHRRPLVGQLSLMFQTKERLARRRMRRRVILGFAFCVFATLGVWGIGIVSYNKHLTINDVSVSGANILSPKLVKAAFEATLYDGAYHFFSNANIFLYPRESLQIALLKKFTNVRSISISRPSLFSPTVQIGLIEREPAYLWCLPGKVAASHVCYEMDERGYVFSPADTASTTKYVFIGGLDTTHPVIAQTFLRGRLNRMIELLKDIERVGFTPRRVTIENDRDATIELSQGFYLKISLDTDALTIARNLQLIISSDMLKGKMESLSYIDLRFGDRIYYLTK